MKSTAAVNTTRNDYGLLNSTLCVSFLVILSFSEKVDKHAPMIGISKAINDILFRWDVLLKLFVVAIHA